MGMDGEGVRRGYGEGERSSWPRLREGVGSAVVGVLLAAVVVSVIVGSGPALFVTLLAAWGLLPLVVGLDNVLEAGCAFMLISVGVLVVVGVAQHGVGYLLP